MSKIFDEFHEDQKLYTNAKECARAWLENDVLLHTYSVRPDVTDAQRSEAYRILRWIAGYEAA